MPSLLNKWTLKITCAYCKRFHEIRKVYILLYWLPFHFHFIHFFIHSFHSFFHSISFLVIWHLQPGAAKLSFLRIHENEQCSLFLEQLAEFSNQVQLCGLTSASQSRSSATCWFRWVGRSSAVTAPFASHQHPSPEVSRGSSSCCVIARVPRGKAQIVMVPFGSKMVNFLVLPLSKGLRRKSKRGLPPY